MYGREGELLARLGPEQRPRALLEGVPPVRRVLTGEETAWLGIALEELRVKMGKAQECARRAQRAVDRVQKGKSQQYIR